jgi:uncharacterized protein (TIGR02147 family)
VVDSEPVHIFEYLDYRQYLRAFYASQKQKSRAFSHRAFSRRAGLRSSNYLSLVMKGERDLSSEMAPRFARACGLGKREASFFCDLVQYCQARTTEEKSRYHERLARFGRFREAHQLLGEQTAYHQHWYMPAIRELVSLPGFDEDPKWIAGQLEPAISPRQAAEALETLCRLGLLVRDERGKLRQAQALLTTGPGPLGHQIFLYHHGMIDLAKQALDRLPREQRDISSLTLCVAEGTVAVLKQRIRELRQELLQLAELETSPERVVQLNFQMFPLSRVTRGGRVNAKATPKVRRARARKERS